MKEKRKNIWLKIALIGLCAVALMFGLTTGSVWAHEDDPHPHAEDSVAKSAYRHPKHGTLGEYRGQALKPARRPLGADHELGICPRSMTAT